MALCPLSEALAHLGYATMTETGKYAPDYARRLQAEAEAKLTPADKWWGAEMRALHMQRIELVHGERVMVRILVKVSVVFMVTVLAGTWLWLRLTGRT